MDREQARTEIEQLFEVQLLGPGAMDEVLDARPADIYLTGILWPRDTEIDPADDDAGASGLADAEGDAGPVELALPGYRAVRPCSIGLTFETDRAAEVTVSLGSTARYVRVPAEGAAGAAPAAAEAETPPGAAKAEAGDRWHREPLAYRVLIPADETRRAWRTHEFLLPDGRVHQDGDVAVDLRRREAGDRIVFTATLINTAVAPDDWAEREAALLFQTRIEVTARHPDGTPAVRPRDGARFADDEDALSNALLYRDVREFAVGHGVAAEWPAEAKAVTDRVGTTWLPRARVAGTSPDGHSLTLALRSRTPSPLAAATLADASRRGATCAELDEFCDLYGRWIATALAVRLDGFAGTLREAADANHRRCADTLVRLRRGIALLRTSDTAWRAFTLANRAIDLQARFPAKGDRARPLVWRPFQLAFILLVMPGLVDPTDRDRDTMDLLWFPTGGGKTEAYLAITAFEIFHRRLTSEHCRRSGGVDVLMRYTLRLLTIQQFQRAAALITACEMLRRDDEASLGTAPISLGLYVGGDATPNHLKDAVQRLDEERKGLAPPSTPRQLLACPACGGNLGTGAYRVDTGRAAMQILCGNAGCATAGRPLPVATVDEAIYASPPSLLIGTVDKFAQLPRNGRIRTLFGVGTPQRLGLIIQDELHLISGPLGSMAGLYEATVDLMCTAAGVRPKIIGSTATIGRAATQVRALFDRSVLQFPPPGFDASDSFFAVRDERGPDRIYRGVASAGRSPKFALQAVFAALMQSVQSLRDAGAADEVVDPYWTCVGYFNSLRELGAAHVLMLDDVRRQMDFLAGRLGTAPRPTEGPPLELSSRMASRDIPQVLDQLARPLGSDDPYDPDPPYAVLASNMISVGVDVPRLGLMVVAGQPKSTAEYIQATSRVGRGLPGLVTTLYNFGRPRDLSHFEHFQGYHAALYRSVEATSVTPWAPRARDKALHAVFAAAVRHLVDGLLDDEAAIDFDPADPRVLEIVEHLVRRARAASRATEDAATRRDLDGIVAFWRRKAAESRAGHRRLRYWERKAPFGKTAPHLMCAAEEVRGRARDAKPTPNSLREVEPSTAFLLKRIPRRESSDA